MPVPTFDEIMDFFAPHNREAFDTLCGLVRERKVIPFIGSGMSAFCFPTFKDFLGGVYASQFPKAQMPANTIDAATKLERMIGRNGLLKEIALAYGGTPGFDWDEVAAKAQGEPVAMLGDLFGDMAVTTNLDRVLEVVLGPLPVAHPGCFGQLGLALSQGGDRLAFKVYGTVEDQPTMLLTRKDCDGFYGPKGEHALALKSAFAGSSFLFLGCSLTDTADDIWIGFSQAGKDREGSVNFAFVACKPTDKAKARQARHKELSGKNIQAILYDESDHTAVRVLLEALYSQAFGKPYTASAKPAPNTLPKRNPNFFARQKQLEAIAEGFWGKAAKGRTASRTLVIDGPGGVGKSQLALEYAHLHRDRYTDGICWIDADNEVSLVDSAFEFAQKAGFGGKATTENLPSWIADWIATREKSLVIFDGSAGKTISAYMPCMPDKPASHVILIPHDAEDGKGTNETSRISLDAFTSQESRAFLLGRSGRKPGGDAEILDEIASRLACLPLALEHAAVCIAKQGISFADYLESLGQYGLVPAAGNTESTATDSSHLDIVAATCAGLLSLVELSDPAAMQLLYVCAHCAPSPIPLEVLSSHSKALPSPLRERVADQAGIEEMVTLLSGFSLAQATGFNTITIHRLVQEAVRTRLEQGAICLDAAFAALADAIPKSYGTDSQDYDLFHRIAVHAHVVAGQFAEAHPDDPESQKLAANLFENVGQGYLDVTVHDENALDAHLQCLQIRKRVLGDDHPDTATSYSNIASAYRSMGKFDEALPLYSQALEMHLRTSGENSHGTLFCLNAIGFTYSSQGECEKALETHARAEAICEKHSVRRNEDMAAAFNGIAMALFLKGEAGEGLEWFLKTLGMREAVLGPDHVDTIATCTNIGSSYLHLDKRDKALEWYGKVLDMYTRVLGPDHSILAGVLSSMGMVHFETGDLDAALECHRKAFHIRQKALRPAHPDRASACEDIARVLFHKGDIAASLEWSFKTLAIREKSLGRSNPATINCCMNIALSCLASFKLLRALKWFCKAQLRRLKRA